MIDQRKYSCSAVLVCLRVLFLNLLTDYIHFTLSLRLINTIFEKSYHFDVPVSSLGRIFVAEGQRYPGLCAYGIIKIGGHDANDSVRFTINHNLSAENSSIPAVILLPQGVTQQNNPIASWLALVCRECSTDCRSNADRFEDIG